MVSWQDLLASSHQAVGSGLSSSVRRSVNTAYYAMFHALAGSNPDCLVGRPQTDLEKHAWQRAYRGMGHSDAKTYLNQDRNLFSPPVQRFIQTFGELQDARHAADYHPLRTFTPSEARHWINRAGAAITEFIQVGQNERTAVAIQALIRRRTQ